MDAWLFAAGNGMRLRPLTNDLQKCLLPVRGKPMLEWWLDATFESEVFDRVYVNIHYMADQVDEWIRSYSNKKKRTILVVDERTALLGTAGTIYFHAEDGREIMTAYTDTFSSLMLEGGGILKLYEKWRHARDASRLQLLAGLVPFKSPPDASAGRIITDATEQRLVTKFREKASGQGIAWSGVAFLDPKVLDLIGPTDKDLAAHVLPKLCYRSIAVGIVDAYDIGRGVEEYERFRYGRENGEKRKEPGVQAA